MLTERDDVRADVQQRFAEVMVDEFQDTNELQCAIVDAVAGPDATCSSSATSSSRSTASATPTSTVFRRRRDEVRQGDGEGAISLRTNYRSRPEVLAVVNHLFGDAFGPTYEPLQPSDGAFPELRPDEPAVEFLVTDASGPSEIEPRDAEAAMLAKRIAQLVAEGSCSAGDVVLLFSAGTDAARYEQALQAAGLDTVSATGRKYFEAQPVRDLTRVPAADPQPVRRRRVPGRHRLAAGRRLATTRSRGCAPSAPKRPLYTSVENGIPTTVDPDDGRLLAAFRQRFDRLVEAAGRSSLGALVERIVDDHDYDLALLANPYGAAPAGERAQAGAAGARVRGTPRPRPGGLPRDRRGAPRWRPTASPTRWCRRRTPTPSA